MLRIRSFIQESASSWLKIVIRFVSQRGDEMREQFALVLALGGDRGGNACVPIHRHGVEPVRRRFGLGHPPLRAPLRGRPR
jgi:hypothetical protein